MHWRLHLGVHKTATTHLQLSLEAIRPQLAEQGVDFIPLDELRAATHLNFDWAKRFKGFKFKRDVRSVTNGLETVILSEENWLGHPYEGCRFPPYPRTEERLKVIAKLGGTFSVFLAVRDPGQFVPSIYSEALRHHPEKVLHNRAKNAWLEGGSPWSELVERISRIFPNVTVWRYEDYHPETAASALAGVPVTLPEISEPELTKRLPAEAVSAIEKGGDRRKPAEGTTRFEMFTLQERACLTEAYNNDIERIRQRGILLAPVNVNLTAVQGVSRVRRDADGVDVAGTGAE